MSSNRSHNVVRTIQTFNSKLGTTTG